MIHLKVFLQEEVQDILEWLDEHGDDVVRIVSFQWKGILFTWEHDFSHKVSVPEIPFSSDLQFESWEKALEFGLECVMLRYTLKGET